MKKLLVFTVAIMLVMAVFAGCSGGAGTSGDPADIKGEIFEGGEVSALVPEGWIGFHGADYWEEYEEGYDPTVIQIVKDGETEFDMFTHPYLQISYFPADYELYDSRDVYENVEDVEPVTIGDYTWEGFSGTSLDTPITLLSTVSGDNQFQVIMCTKMSEGEISLDDADVQAILASIAH